MEGVEPFPSGIGALEWAAEAEVEELVALGEFVEGFGDWAVGGADLEAGFFEHACCGGGAAGEVGFEDVAGDEDDTGDGVGAAGGVDQAACFGEVGFAVVAVGGEFSEAVGREGPLAEVRGDDAVDLAVLAVPAVEQALAVERERGGAGDAAVGEGCEQLDAVVERGFEQDVVGFVFLDVADDLIGGGEAEPVDQAGVVGGDDFVLGRAGADEAGGVGAVAGTPPVWGALEGEFAVAGEGEGEVRAGAAGALDVLAVLSPGVAVFGGGFGAGDPGPGAGVGLEEADVWAVAGHADAAVVDGFGGEGEQVVGAADEFGVVGAGGVERGLLAFDVEADVVGEDGAAIGRRAVPEAGEGLEREDVGLLVGRFGEGAEVGFEFIEAGGDGTDEAVVHQADDGLGLAVAGAMGVPEVDLAEAEPEAGDAAGGRAGRGLGDGLLFGLGLGLLFLLAGDFDLGFDLLLGEFLGGLLGGEVCLGIVIAAAADESEAGSADAGAGGGGEQRTTADAPGAALP